MGSNSPENTDADIEFVQIVTNIVGSEIVILDGTIRWLRIDRGPGTTPVTAYVLSSALNVG